MAADLIAQLRDIHYPAPISPWPLAVGWYYLIALILSLIFFAIYFWFKSLKKRQLKKNVLHRLDELQKQQEGNESIAEELSKLLKRVALAIYPRQQVAGLHGEDWLNFLDRTSMTTEFTQGLGRLLIVCPYQAKNQKLPEQLFHLIKNWVRKNL